MTLDEFVSSIPEFASWNHADKIRFFAWYLHTHEKVAELRGADLTRCFESLHLSPPANIHSALSSMESRKPKELLRTRNGYRLEKRLRDPFDAKYGEVASTVKVRQLLEDLPARVPSLAKRAYLDETLRCFKHEAFRAAIVMAWNLAFDHLCDWILTKHLTEFNAQLPKSFPKAEISVIAKRDDFSELKESQVLQVCRSANITSQSLHKVLKEKLDRRNVAAHPSGVVVTQPTAEDCIIDLIENVVIALT